MGAMRDTALPHQDPPRRPPDLGVSCPSSGDNISHRTHVRRREVSTFTASQAWNINTDYTQPRVMAQDGNGAFVPLAPFAVSAYPDNVTLRRALREAAENGTIADALESHESRFLNYSWVDAGSVLAVASHDGNLSFFAQPGTDAEAATTAQAKIVRAVGTTFPSIKANRNRRSATFATTPVAAAAAIVAAVVGVEKVLDR